MSSFLPLSLNPPSISPLHQKPHFCLQFNLTPILFSRPHSLSKSIVCFSLPGNSSDFDREEVRWLREEQRWLREEQRWLREEQRWILERESLLREIADLKLQIQDLESGNSVHGGVSVSETIRNIGALLQVLKEKNRIAESGSSASEMVLEEKRQDEEEAKEVVIRVLDGENKKEKKRKTLRKGSEGEDVQAMQEALQNWGFYSGEEDMEYSSFSSGTERAVKTWQASLGVPEDGIMTVELLERLFVERIESAAGSKLNVDQTGTTPTGPKNEGANGAAVASLTEISEIQHTVVEKEGGTEVEVSQHRVFLLGENRWEEPSRLAGRDTQGTGSKTRNAATKCLTCRGEGRLLCTECDGTGEPNVEPQFLEWVDEGAKCPYCEGLGYTICDLCEGKTLL